MRYFRTLGLAAIVGGGLSLVTVAQKKQATPIQPITPGTQVQNRQLQPEVALERNKVPVRQLYEEMFSHGRYELQDLVFSRDCKVHFGNSRHLSLEQAVAEGKGWRSAAPDMRMTINNMTVNGEMVNVDWTATGTHTGNGHGLKPSGKPVNLRGSSRFRVLNGKIVEAWNEEYRPELFRQLGVSRTQAFMFFATDRLLATLDPIIPDRLYAFLFE